MIINEYVWRRRVIARKSRRKRKEDEQKNYLSQLDLKSRNQPEG